MITVIVADDHPLTREGAKRTLERMSYVRVVGEAGTGPELEAALARVPDVLLLDLRMPNFDAVKQVPELRARFPDMKIVVMTAYESEFFVQTLMPYVDGYLLKRESMDAVATAVQDVSRGIKHFTPRAVKLILNSRDLTPLSTREIETIELAARGLTTAEIAQEMFISSRTVESHMQAASQKLGVRGRPAVVAKAIALSLISPWEREDIP